MGKGRRDIKGVDDLEEFPLRTRCQTNNGVRPNVHYSNVRGIMFGCRLPDVRLNVIGGFRMDVCPQHTSYVF